MNKPTLPTLSDDSLRAIVDRKMTVHDEPTIRWMASRLLLLPELTSLLHIALRQIPNEKEIYAKAIRAGLAAVSHIPQHTETGRPMTRKQTSSKVSRLASKYLGATDAELKRISIDRLFADLRTLAASCLSQDEVKGK